MQEEDKVYFHKISGEPYRITRKAMVRGVPHVQIMPEKTGRPMFLSSQALPDYFSEQATIDPLRFGRKLANMFNRV